MTAVQRSRRPQSRWWLPRPTSNWYVSSFACTAAWNMGRWGAPVVPHGPAAGTEARGRQMLWRERLLEMSRDRGMFGQGLDRHLRVVRHRSRLPHVPGESCTCDSNAISSGRLSEIPDPRTPSSALLQCCLAKPGAIARAAAVTAIRKYEAGNRRRVRRKQNRGQSRLPGTPRVL